MNFKSKKGMTLFALVITIIVMIILATVTIARVIGDDGVLEKTRKASLESEKGKFLESAKMAYSALGVQMKDKVNLGEITMADLKNKLMSDYDYDIFTVKGGKVFLDAKDIEIGPGESTSLFTDLSTDEDVNYVFLQGLYYQIKLVNGEISLGAGLRELPEDGERLEGEFTWELADENLVDVTQDADGDITVKAKDDVTGNTQLTLKYADGVQKTVNVHVIEYLADQVHIGEYVDIGINYSNVCFFNSADRTVTKKALTGWRVLDVSGTGKDGVVKLISAGCPLTYCFRKNDMASKAIIDFQDLYNKEITYTAEGTTGFKSNGFSTAKLNTIFKADRGVDVSKGIHVFSNETNSGEDGVATATGYEPLNEFENLYNKITGDTKTLETIQKHSYDELENDNLQKVAEEHHVTWLDSYNDMFLIGQEVFYGGKSYDKDRLYYSDRYGNVDHGDYDPNKPEDRDELEIGLRLVVSLKPGTLFASENQGDGKSSSTAYKIVVR